ncbi:unnamed protein product [Calicophoron daubneyi]|uniref:Cationic amino acid transporter C-terminal domain-containing protein n=1 Tax=Calicophoron daubneyi TaxID=300641 RepID=A0AAV2TNI8_CALDB
MKAMFGRSNKSDETPILDEPGKKNGCCTCSEACQDYDEAVRVGVNRRKQLSSEEETLLKTNLKRCLNTFDLFAYGLASMLGGSIYVLTGAVMRKRTGPSVFLAYFVAGMVALLNAAIYSELACRVPKAGSSYTYAYILLGELLAFLTGWSILLEYILSTSTVARGWSSMLDGLCDRKISQWIITNVGRMANPGEILGEYPDFVGVAAIIVMASISCCGVRGGARVTGFFMMINFFVLLTISAYMFVYSQGSNIAPALANTTLTADEHSPNPLFLPFGVGGLIGGIAICFNAFIGFDAISTCAEEAKTPNRSLPRANMAAVLAVTFITMTASLALTLYYPWYGIHIDTPFLTALVENTEGGSASARNAMFYFVGIGCLIGLTSSLLSNLVAGPRINYAMSEDGLLPFCCASVCKPFRTPAVATAFVAFVTALLTLIFSIESLADFLSLGTLMAYSIASVGILMLRYGPPPETRKIIYAPGAQDGMDAPICRDEQSFLVSADGLERVGHPGYIKNSWSHYFPSDSVRYVNKGSPGQAVTILMSIFIFLTFFLIIVLRVGAPAGAWPVWRIVLTVVFVILMIGCVVMMSAYGQFSAPRRDLYRVPCVPLFPCATLAVNMFLISQLSWITWVRFAIWFVIGIFIYFFYGVCHSRAAAEEGYSWAIGQPPEQNIKS